MADKPRTRSFRIEPAIWEAARARAQSEGKNMSQVLQLLTEGYAHGVVQLPRRKVTMIAP